MPRVNDFKAGGRSNLIVANYLHQHGVRVYFYPGMTHVKALLVDGWACLGPGNLNHLSLHLCQEENIATSDPAFAHSAYILLIDRRGRQRIGFPAQQATPEDIAHDLRRLEAER